MTPTAEMADYVVVMYAGRVVEKGTATEVFKNPQHPYTIGLMEAIPNIDKPVPPGKKLKTIPGLVPDLLVEPGGCYYEKRCSMAYNPCAGETPQLVEVTPGHRVRCWLHV